MKMPDIPMHVLMAAPRRPPLQSALVSENLLQTAISPWLKALSRGCRGGMGNIMEDTHGHGEASRTGQPGGGVHGVLHRLKPLDLARLTHMEHEYRSAAPLTPPQPAC